MYKLLIFVILTTFFIIFYLFPLFTSSNLVSDEQNHRTVTVDINTEKHKTNVNYLPKNNPERQKVLNERIDELEKKLENENHLQSEQIIKLLSKQVDRQAEIFFWFSSILGTLISIAATIFVFLWRKINKRIDSLEKSEKTNAIKQKNVLSKIKEIREKLKVEYVDDLNDRINDLQERVSYARIKDDLVSGNESDQLRALERATQHTNPRIIPLLLDLLNDSTKPTKIKIEAIYGLKRHKKKLYKNEDFIKAIDNLKNVDSQELQKYINELIKEVNEIGEK